MMKTKLIITFCLCFALLAAHSHSAKNKINQDSLKKVKATVDSVKKAKANASLVFTAASTQKPKADSIKKAKLAFKPAQKAVVINTPKAFQGLKQYRTWSVGINAGILAGSVLTGGENDFRKGAPDLGYGIQVRKQLGHTFGLQFDIMQGHISGSVPRDYDEAVTSYRTEIGYSATTSIVANIGSISFMRRKHSINFFALGGEGFMGFAPKVFYFDGTSEDTKYHNGFLKDKVYVHEFTTFVGMGIKFKLTDRFSLNTGYTENFIDDDFLDGLHNYQPNGRDYQKDKFSYGYASLEFSIGKRAKPNIDWINPISLLYNELEDHTVRDEFEMLRLRLTSVEATIVELRKDDDQDGVPDYFDKCPGTPKGIVVDGAGCPVKADTAMIRRDSIIREIMVNGTNTIIHDNNALDYGKTVLFNYNSTEVLPAYFNVLNAIAQNLKANPTKTIAVNGYSSSEGVSSHNMQLSLQRAKNVKAYLIKAGVDPKQISIKSYGETKAVANNANEEGRMLNRRVQIY